MATLKENVLLFSSGRKLKIQNGTIGINCFLEVSQGFGTAVLRYDADSARDNDVDPVYNAHFLSKEEALEMTEYAILLWSNLKANIQAHGLSDAKIFDR